MSPFRHVLLAYLIALGVYVLAQVAPGAKPSTGLSVTTATTFGQGAAK